MTTPQIIAHRGASYLAPENTLVAFRKAMEIGADGVEMDVQKTYDNELVIHHDYMVDMHTDISGQIYDLTMGELKALDFGSWKDAIYANERIATLQEALDAEEAFITSATSLVMPVTTIDGHTIHNGAPGPAALRLREIYVDFARKGGVLG